MNYNMSAAKITLGIFFIMGGLLFLFRPKTLFTTNPKKDIERIKKYEESLTPNKILFIRFGWSLALLYGIYLIYSSI